ncbi:ABC transporter ATP-binding protein [Vulgatibacter incomptus]|uniref:ABC transporter, ATP-binding protein n=1 Tax=Vulgatibacter incomptus TaxID=1391653 RepID=A0A0K1P8W7_9BACT|nr:ABC transporter ATP-binding protein [Vulgatibacter incomptus]AKU89973.1 ABC transporter, ATP-binding protein [Vulgatibacter incomptus]
MIRLESLTKSYRDGGNRFDVLRGVSLGVEEGELVAVMGASGSGKSTLLNVIGGLDRDYGGSAEVLGRDLSKLGDRELSRYRNESVGFVFQSFNLVPPLTVLQNVLLPGYFEGGGGQPAAAARSSARDALARVGLAGKEGRLPARLSGGERQRVALARALFRRPRLVLADEPTGSLDAQTARDVIDLLVELNVKERLTVVVVTHDEQVASRARRILRLKDGLLVDDREHAR